MEDIKDSVKESFLAILPVSAVIILLQIFLIGLPLEKFLLFLIGLLMVTFGLMFFLMGVNIGLLPVGDMIGKALPKPKKKWLIIVVGLLLGIAVTVAEPDVRVLATQVDEVSDGKITSTVLILSVALGVGIFVALAMVRTIYKIKLPYFIMPAYLLVFLLGFFTPETFVPISFDAGGVTTGPLTVPFILALGVGVASVLRKDESSSEGFGLVALASIGPILAVLLLGVIYQ
ncbi:DUF1538 domain-containing protein [Sutcliffiella horikoshii]|uniref:DUF1538 domain-containing protein n=1 Tax=Sutcliffiella horikoshii TaxID=79883 RepID=A0AA94WQL2_9BACI|nr:DUF1538 domain-containing protein [Sutcliffiella horikoshii]TYS60818.1 DUF1538 domain-containing protein [Sutcliffiella horikoshii]